VLNQVRHDAAMFAMPTPIAVPTAIFLAPGSPDAYEIPQITSAARLPTLATVPVINVENEEKKLSNGVRMIAPAELSGDA